MQLATGAFDEKKDFRYSGYPGSVWAVFATPAVRGSTAFIPTHYMGVSAYDFATRRSLWAARTDNTLDQRRFTGLALRIDAILGITCEDDDNHQRDDDNDRRRTTSAGVLHH